MSKTCYYLNDMDFCFILKQLRKEHGLTQKELAEKSGLRQSHISAWESGEKLPIITSIIKLADFFDCSVDYLLGRTTKKKMRK